jgi:hypothetical protein
MTGFAFDRATWASASSPLEGPLGVADPIFAKCELSAA